MGRECDNCDKADYTPENPRVFVCLPRPSDPSEMCCVIAGHKECFAPNETMPAISERSGGTATGEQWNEWIESAAAMKEGFLFLSL